MSIEQKMEFILEQQAAIDVQLAKLAEAQAENSAAIKDLIKAQAETNARMEKGFAETRAGFAETRWAINKLMDICENARDKAMELDRRVAKLEKDQG
jgi:chromosome segregation ATPase